MRRGKRELKNETTIKGTASGGKNKKSKNLFLYIILICNCHMFLSDYCGFIGLERDLFFLF